MAIGTPNTPITGARIAVGTVAVNAYSIFARIYVSSTFNRTTNAWGALVGLSAAGIASSMFQLSSTTLNLVVTGGAASSTILTLSADTWYDVALSYTGTPGAGALIGYARATGDATAFATQSTSGVDIAGTQYLGLLRAEDGEFVGGRIEHVRLWTSVLTAAELEAERAAAAPVITANLWGDWRLPDRDTLTDSSGNGRTLTEVVASSLTTETGSGVGGGGGSTQAPRSMHQYTMRRAA